MSTKQPKKSGSCPTCHGTGMILCSSCGGAAYSIGLGGQPVACVVCGGTGQKKCVTCAGSGGIGDYYFEVRGNDAKEVERVATSLAKEGLRRMAKPKKIEINLKNSTVGVLTAGDVHDVESISVNVSALSEAGNERIASAFKELTEAVVSNTELVEEKRTEVLDNLEELARQAALPKDKRSKAGVLKAIFASVGGTLAATGGLAEVWSTWGNEISQFLGLLAS